MALYEIKLSNGMIIKQDLDAGGHQKMLDHVTHGCLYYVPVPS